MNERKNNRFKTWRDSGKTLFFALIAEMDLVVKNLINIFFISRFLGSEGTAAYEIVMPCVMVASAFVALGYNGVQAVCAKDYGARDFEAFERHKNAGYTWILLVMAVLTLLFAVFQTPMLDLLGANEGSEALARLSRECYSLFLLNFVPQGLFSIASCLLFFEERRKLLVTNLILYGTMLSGGVFVTCQSIHGGLYDDKHRRYSRRGSLYYPVHLCVSPEDLPGSLYRAPASPCRHPGRLFHGTSGLHGIWLRGCSVSGGESLSALAFLGIGDCGHRRF